MIVIIDQCGLLGGRLPPRQELQAASTPCLCRGWVCENVRYQPDGSSEVESTLTHGLISQSYSSSTGRAQLAGRGAGSQYFVCKALSPHKATVHSLFPFLGTAQRRLLEPQSSRLRPPTQRSIARILFLATVGNQIWTDGKLPAMSCHYFCTVAGSMCSFFFCCCLVVPPSSRTPHSMDSRSVHHSIHSVATVPLCVGSFRSSPRLFCINTASNRGSSPGILRERS